MSRNWMERIFGATLLVALGAVLSLHLLRAEESEVSVSATRASLDEGKVTEYVVDLLVSHRCGGCQYLGQEGAGFLNVLRDSLESRLAVNESVERRRVVVRIHGLDSDLRRSQAFIDDFGTPDEFSVGRRWLNEAAITLLWRDHVSLPVVPQIIVRRREIDVHPPMVRISEDEVLFKRMGADEILRWAEIGYPLNPSGSPLTGD